MEYKEFLEEVMGKLKNFYGNDAEIIIKKVVKNNNLSLDGLHIIFKENSKGVIPIIYLNQYYDQYISGKMSIEECVGNIVDLRQGTDIPFDSAYSIISRVNDWENVKEIIYPLLISTAENQEAMNELVNTTFLDLSVIYVIRLKSTTMASATIKITNVLLQQYGVSKEMLHAQAINNLKKDGYTFTNLVQMISEMANSVRKDNMMEDIMPMFVVTNNMRCFGAAGILNSEFLKEECRGKSFFIIPSSVHETIFVPDDGVSQEELDIMVHQVNQEQVAAEERLADHTYYYDCRTGEIRINKCNK